VSRGWARSTLSKIMRAKSTTENDSYQLQDSPSPYLSRKNKSSAAAGGGGGSNVSSIEDCHKSLAEGSHIDICVMPPTASPAASIRSTLSGDSLDRLMTGGAADGTSMARQQQHLSVRERLWQFARMKGQTIVDGGDATASTNLFDHALTIDTTAAAGGRGDHIHSTQRCRSASPSNMRNVPATCADRLSPSCLLQVQRSSINTTTFYRHQCITRQKICCHYLPPLVYSK